jgi:hypothetical protein
MILFLPENSVWRLSVTGFLDCVSADPSSPSNGNSFLFTKSFCSRVPTSSQADFAPLPFSVTLQKRLYTQHFKNSRLEIVYLSEGAQRSDGKAFPKSAVPRGRFAKTLESYNRKL